MFFPKKYHAVTIASILIVLSLVILSFNLKRPDEVGFVRKLVMEVAAPIESLITGTFEGIRGVWKRYIFLVGVEDENRSLKKKVDSLTNEIIRYREAYLESTRLKEHLSLRESQRMPMVSARVVGKENSSIFKTILINKGTADGMKAGLAVISVEGVVGRIVESSWNVSRVLLAIDYNSNIDAMIQGTRSQGILQGGGAMGCNLKYVERSEEVKVGDAVLTSGMGGIFPKGLLIGTVVSVDRKDSGLFQKIEVMPAVYFSRLEEVSVILPEEKPL
ncbi:MAG: rod shape-determining protein MreC [Syntrophales bacterium]|nr:rod shape-determining protein MreC [Syntrophales bacterium]MDD5233731.1 rod shape-determining protein MreC [Syntrophales bacterium]MDD5531507.1 rod shape-determining protein MreC [Syntrophales bacterium]